MSGSALDGLDIAICHFQVRHQPDFQITAWDIVVAETISYSAEWQQRLAVLPKSTALEFAAAHAQYGHYVGDLVSIFLTKHPLEVDVIASHGHTIFHYPEQKFTTQIGDGAAIASVTGLPVISDLRALDVASGGQGAPIAAIADKYLFSDFDFCLNLGGIANVTYQNAHKNIAFDISGANQILNALASTLGLEYDEGGNIARTGQVNPMLLKQSNSLDYFNLDYPKTLDNQWVQLHLVQLFHQSTLPIQDRLRTAVEHIAEQISISIQGIIDKEKIAASNLRLLATGGGAFNTFLMELIQDKLPQVEIVVPPSLLVSNKEAVMVALMGVMRIENVPNCIHTVTGAARSVIGGAIHQGWKKYL
jgi:anhydro-N-acetylmuramic acid kinase